MKRVDQRFDEILIKEVPLKVTEAFLDLEMKIRVSEHMTVAMTGEVEEIIKKKANQMKIELNNFIDSQVERIISRSNIQVNSDFLNPEGLGVKQNQRKK